MQSLMIRELTNSRPLGWQHKGVVKLSYVNTWVKRILCKEKRKLKGAGKSKVKWDSALGRISDKQNKGHCM